MTHEELRDSVAVVGMSGRFPGAHTIDQFWQNLSQGVESVSFFTKAELERSAIDPAEIDDPNYVKARAVLDNVELFDADFFGFTPKEAEISDPQQRIFLECAWEALEHAGYNPERYPGLIGIYGGAGANTYLLFHLLPTGHLIGSAQTLRAFIHNKNDHLTTRVAYKLNLRGPSVSVQTACSTSLVAVCLACQSLLNYQADMVLAGGVSIILPQKTGYLYHQRGIGSPDGHCRAFDASAQGTVGGNGAGVVVLKRFEDALADGDTIHAVIRGSAINNDGALRAGYTAPNAASQAEVIALAQALSGVDVDTISYIEAHGTGTPIGDPIEIQALTEAFRRRTQRQRFCAIGSVKTNIGHLDTAAGIAGLIKTILALRHRQIPPSIHFETPNPAIDFAHSPFYINTMLRDWHTDGVPRRAGVSAFGLGGANAHVVLEEAPPQPPSGPARPWHLLVLTGHTAAAMEQASTALVTVLRQQPELHLADVVYTLQVGRKAFAHRRMLVCQDRDNAITALEGLAPGRVFTRAQESIHRPLTFMFPGQGAQYVSMAAELYRGEPLFRAEVDRCAELLIPHLGLDIRELLYPPEGAGSREQGAGSVRGTDWQARPPAPDPRPLTLDQTQYAQPALFVIEYALAQLWMAWGLRPQSLIGHSVGEYVAACLAGVFTLDDALALVALRGRLIQSLPTGAMLVIPLPKDEVEQLLAEQGDSGLALAAVNGLAQCVVSGPLGQIDALERQLTAEWRICRRLQTSHAFHSAMMEPILDRFADFVAQVRLSPPQMPYLSNVTGTWITAQEAVDPRYWARHIRQTVRFADGLAVLLQDPHAVLLEVGPGHALRTLARWHPHKQPDQFMLASLPRPRADGAPESDYASLLNTLGQLWLVGLEVDWQAMYVAEQRRRLPLSTYPFQRQRHWVELPAHVLGNRPIGAPAGKRTNIADWFYVPMWKSVIPPLQAAASAVPRMWLLFMDACGVVEQVAVQLERAGCRIVRVWPGWAFQQHSPHSYTLCPEESTGYNMLLAALRAQTCSPEQILHCWSMMPTDEPTPDTQLVLDRCFMSLLYLAQALGRQPTHDPLTLFVLSNNLQAVLGDELRFPERALVFGPCLVIPREYPNIACRNIDIMVPPTGSWQEHQLVDQLFQELSSSAPARNIAYRNGRRWEQIFEPIRFPPANGRVELLRPAGTYFITGGLGGIGMTIATYLAQTVQAKLVLVGRTIPPERDQWSHWLATHDPDDRRSQQIRQIQQLDALGAQVMVAQADVADESQMRAVVARAQAQFGPINGVLHAAGIPGGGMIQQKEPQTVAAVLAPKLRGTQVLASLFAGANLDWLIIQSSLTSVVGRLGQVDYTAANAFLDAFAHDYHARTGTFTTAINWGAWDQVGMAAQPNKAAPAPEPELAESDVVPIAHPLLDRRILETPDREIFVTDFRVDKHWALDEHRILGNPVVPGVAYFEMVRAALGSRTAGCWVEFQDVLFVVPLRVADGETREMQLVLRTEPDGYTFVTRSASGTHATGKVRLCPAQPLTHYDLALLRQRCDQREVLLAEEQRENDLGPRWHTVERVYLGHNEVLLVQELPAAFAADFATMQFHPALLDRAAGIAKNFLVPEGYYLPLMYKRLTIQAPLQRRLYSYARFYEAEYGDRETITFDLVLMDEAGVELVEVTGFTQKRVNDPGVEIRALADQIMEPLGVGSAAHPAQAEHTRPSAADSTIQPTEGIEVFARILAAGIRPQIIVSPSDLQATLAQTDSAVRERILEAVVVPPASALKPRPNLKTTYIAPETEIEHIIARAWQNVLGLERIGVQDNFFELGGDSLIAIQVISYLERELDATIPPVMVFEGATIQTLAQLLSVENVKKPAYEERQSRGEERRNRVLERRRKR